MTRRLTTPALCLLFTVLASGGLAQTPPPAAPGPAGAGKDDNPTGWTVKAGLSYVQTTGNSKSDNLGARFSVNYNWTRTFFSLTGAAVRNDSATITRLATGSPSDFDVQTTEISALTAANYFLDANLDHNLTDRFFWTTGAGWMRNTFAGIDSRENVRGGVGYYFTDPASKGVQFKTALLGTLTHQTETIEDPTSDDTFIGLRLMADLLVPFATGSFNSRTNLDENLQSTDDFRWAWWNSLTLNMSERLGLQVSWLLLYDHLPALESIPLFATSPPVSPPVGDVLVPLGNWDNQFAVSLVVNLVPKKK
jgi:hypothetical protein